MIASMLALTAFAADKGKDFFVQMDTKKSARYQRAVTLYQKGCAHIEEGYVENSNQCIKAFSLLNKVVLNNDNTFDANFYLSKIYLYQPQSFNWNSRSDSKDELKKIGIKHLKKALKINPNHKEARQLYSRLKTKKASSL